VQAVEAVVGQTSVVMVVQVVLAVAELVEMEMVVLHKHLQLQEQPTLAAAVVALVTLLLAEMAVQELSF
jgi:hypothetical protein